MTHRLLALFVFLVIVRGQIPHTGSCPDLQTVQNFELQKYLGKWYEAEKYFFIFEVGGKCITAEYTLNDNGTVKVHNTQINMLTGHYSEIIGYAKLAGAPTEAKLIVVFPSLPVKTESPYWVLGTDYQNYAVVWSCEDAAGVVEFRFVWILTRERNPSEATMKLAYDVLDKNGISKDYLLKTDQTNCTEQH